VLYIEDSRRAALEWFKDHVGADKVLWRHTYGQGDYEYCVGFDEYDHDQAYIIREDLIRTGEWKIEGPVSEAVPKFKDGEHV
jgi:hypothetical protein